MTTTAQRREAILQHIQTHQKGEVNEFAQQFDVSEVTIRTDLNVLEKQGCITRCYGGAVLNNQFAFDQPLQDKKQLNRSLKSAIGEYAASLVDEGDTIILDSGSTTEQVALHLKNRQHLVVMTNGINIAYQLANQSDIEVMVCGGTLRKNSYSLHGAGGEEMLTHYRFNKLFLGVDGFDIKTGITTPHRGEADINRKMVDVAQTVIAVTDSSKFDRQSFCLIASLSEVDILITDSGISDQYVEQLTAHGIDVHIVDKNL
ncbi:transcriptional repressor AgaR [Vibrio sonorensis]|uniref:transcriptional repressor AgaR n=1 Tax=Vibrio sonorensis TaxID=1004316 RepID=UPI0008DB08E0|nr:transcriptional repressor AgaR [Vibrio sonorensis]